MKIQEKATCAAFTRLYRRVWKMVDAKSPPAAVVECLADIVRGYATYNHFWVKRRLLAWEGRMYALLDENLLGENTTVENVCEILEFSLYGRILGHGQEEDLTSIPRPHKWQSLESRYAGFDVALDAARKTPKTHSQYTAIKPEKIDFDVLPSLVK